MTDSPPWSESHEGGSPRAEAAIFRTMVRQIRKARAPGRMQAGLPAAGRYMFAKTVCGIVRARLVVDASVPAALAIGHFRPGAVLPAILRFSNASGVAQMDPAPDVRGLAVRLHAPGGAIHDLLMANHPTSFVRDARQLMAMLIASSGERETRLARLAAALGEQESRRIAAAMRAGLRLCASLAEEHYWCGGCYLWGDRPMRFAFRPVAAAAPPDIPAGNGNRLRVDLAARLTAGDLHFRLALYPYADARLTPVEDASAPWPTLPLEIATLVIPQQDIFDADGVDALARVDGLRFSPGNAPATFRPLGSLNRLLCVLYEAGILD